MDQKIKKNILKTKNPQIDLQAITKFQQHIRKNKQNIQRKYEKSVLNKLYIFPRFCPLESPQSESQQSQQDEIPNSYDLKTQNMKNRKQQTNNIISYETYKKKEYNSTKSAKSIQSVESQNENLMSKKGTKTRKMQITFDTKKKTPNKRRLRCNSNQRLLVEQYSLDNRYLESNKKKKSKGLVISFRGTKNQDINVSMSGKRVHTQIY